MTNNGQTLLRCLMLTVVLSAGLLLSALLAPAAYAHAGHHSGHAHPAHSISADQISQPTTPTANLDLILTAPTDVHAHGHASHQHSSATTCGDRDCHAPGHCASSSVASTPAFHMIWPTRETAFLPAYLPPADANAGVDTLKRPPRS